jgi:hypothetical protein
MAQQNKSFIAACDKFEQELVLYYYGELGGLERNQVDTHIAGCEPCRLYLKEMESLLPLTVTADEPPQAFWDDYNREMRHKLAVLHEGVPWWQSLLPSLQAWIVPVFATGAVVILALTLTFGKGLWRSNELPQEDETFMEALPMTENLEFFSNMEVLDAMDMLEFIGGQRNSAV